MKKWVGYFGVCFVNFIVSNGLFGAGEADRGSSHIYAGASYLQYEGHLRALHGGGYGAIAGYYYLFEKQSLFHEREKRTEIGFGAEFVYSQDKKGVFANESFLLIPNVRFLYTIANNWKVGGVLGLEGEYWRHYYKPFYTETIHDEFTFNIQAGPIVSYELSKRWSVSSVIRFHAQEFESKNLCVSYELQVGWSL